MTKPLKEEAAALEARAADIRRMNAFQQAGAIGPFTEQLGGFLCRMAERIDALTPFLDEAESTKEMIDFLGGTDAA